MKKTFKKCPMCGKHWHTKEEFLNDGSLFLKGLQEDFTGRTNGFFLFNHIIKGCNTTLGILRDNMAKTF